jgi:hypothetical protein
MNKTEYPTLHLDKNNTKEKWKVLDNSTSWYFPLLIQRNKQHYYFANYDDH